MLGSLALSSNSLPLVLTLGFLVPDGVTDGALLDCALLDCALLAGALLADALLEGAFLDGALLAGALLAGALLAGGPMDGALAGGGSMVVIGRVSAPVSPCGTRVSVEAGSSESSLPPFIFAASAQA